MFQLRVVSGRWAAALALVANLSLGPTTGAQTVLSKSANSNSAPVSSLTTDEIKALKGQLAAQQQQIERLNSALEDQRRMLEQVLKNSQGPARMGLSIFPHTPLSFGARDGMICLWQLFGHSRLHT